MLHEVTAKSVYGRNEKGDKVHKAQVQRGKLQDGTPIIGMTMLPEDYRWVVVVACWLLSCVVVVPVHASLCCLCLTAMSAAVPHL